MTRLDDRIAALEAKVERLSSLDGRVAVLETKIEQLTATLGSIDPSIVEVVSRMSVEVVGLDEKVAKLEQVVQVVSDRDEAISVRFREFDEEWPKVGAKQAADVAPRSNGRTREVSLQVDGQHSVATQALTWGEKMRDDGDRILVLGDSLARGMGFKLKEQLADRVEVKAVGGAKVQEVSRLVSGLSEDTGRNLVVVAGANSLKKEATEDLVGHFRGIVEHGKRLCRRVVVVGLVKRYDLGPSFERKRILVNRKLRDVCSQSGVGFLEYEPERSRVHYDGLHLNWKGQRELGVAVWQHLKKSFLA